MILVKTDCCDCGRPFRANPHLPNRCGACANKQVPHPSRPRLTQFQMLELE